MDTNRGTLLAKDEVFQIVGCAIEVLNTLGHGLVEKPYENALAVELLCETFLSGSKLCSMFSTKGIRSVSSFPT
jgi:GxxExxY protein